MASPLRLILPALVAVTAASALRADTTGRISGTVTSSDGKPVVGALVVLKRMDIKWSKELKTDAKGAFFQIGLDPKEFEVTVSAPGFTPTVQKLKIPLGDVITANLKLYTQAELSKSADAVAVPTPESASILAEGEATESYNTGVGFYTSKDYANALQPALKAFKGFKEALEKSTEEAAKAGLVENQRKANRLLGMVYFNLGKPEEAKPLLTQHLEQNPTDGIVLNALLKMAKDSKEKDLEAKYQAKLDELTGPQPEIGYNEGVAALNAGNMRGVKEGALKALKAKSDYADGYYLLGIAEFGLNNLKAAKEALRKYMELAPTGSKAAEVKEMLKELR